jgi:hypothetical protein
MWFDYLQMTFMPSQRTKHFAHMRTIMTTVLQQQYLQTKHFVDTPHNFKIFKNLITWK